MKQIKIGQTPWEKLPEIIKKINEFERRLTRLEKKKK